MATASNSSDLGFWKNSTSTPNHVRQMDRLERPRRKTLSNRAQLALYIKQKSLAGARIIPEFQIFRSKGREGCRQSIGCKG